MASPIFLLSPILLFILFHVFSVSEPICCASIPNLNVQTGFHLPKNRYFLNELSPPDQQGVENSLVTGLKSTLIANGDEYTMDLFIGTPPVAFKVVMDTGSDLIWAKCKNNQNSFTSTTNNNTSTSLFSTTKTTTSSSFSEQIQDYINYAYKYYYSHSSPPKTSSSLFDPLQSQSFTEVMEPCDRFELPNNCKLSYVDHTTVSFLLGQETLSLVTTGMTERLPPITFGCGTTIDGNFGYDGVIGMGRGMLSLLSQLRQRVFAYCLPSRFGDESENGVFLTGSEAISAINGNNMIQTMPLLSNNIKGTSHYYLSLEGISVGETELNVMKSDFALTDGTGGMVIDSGATFTLLEDRIVGMIKEEFLIQTKLQKSESKNPRYDVLDLCFMTPYDVNVIPKIVFHFEGADWELGKDNYIYEDESNSQACLGIVGHGKDEISTLGNMQQQNMMVFYDLDGNTLSFMPAECDEF